MSELTLFLIKISYLAILWIFVLSAISVVRSDMFGARLPPGRARGGGAQAAPPGQAEEGQEGLADPRPGRRRRQPAASGPTWPRRRS